MLQLIRERLTLVLIGLLPFHAFLVTVITKLIAGPNQAPLSQLVLWKEILLGLILLISFIELLRNEEWKMKNGKLWRVDIADSLILFLIVLAGFVSILNSQFSILQFAFGFKYDFIPLIAFIVLRRVDWSNEWWKHVKNVLIGSAAVIAVYGLASLILPAEFFRALGYSDLHSLYIPGGPLAPFQQIGGSAIRRMQSVMSGPNQLGIWLLIPYSVLLVSLLQRLSLKKFLFRVVLEKMHIIGRHTPWKEVVVWLLVALCILLSFSRSSWVAAFVITLVAIWQVVPTSIARKLIGGIFLLGAGAGVIAVLLSPSVVVRATSSRGHIDKPMAALVSMIDHPLGMGLGSAGPASNRVSDVCVFLEEGSDASWAADRPDMCVFVADEQIQPTNRDCSCPFLPENWYLQIGVELGVLGFVLFIILALMLIRRLSKAHVSLLAFIGISIAALFLHAWEDAAVAYTAWILVAAAVHSSKRSLQT